MTNVEPALPPTPTRTEQIFAFVAKHPELSIEAREGILHDVFNGVLLGGTFIKKTDWNPEYDADPRQGYTAADIIARIEAALRESHAKLGAESSFVGTWRKWIDSDAAFGEPFRINHVQTGQWWVTSCRKTVPFVMGAQQRIRPQSAPATPREVLDAKLATLTPEQRARVTAPSSIYVDGCVVFGAMPWELDEFGHDREIDAMLAALDAALSKPVPQPTRTEAIKARYADEPRVTLEWSGFKPTGKLAVSVQVDGVWAGSCSDDCSDDFLAKLIAAADALLAKPAPKTTPRSLIEAELAKLPASLRKCVDLYPHVGGDDGQVDVIVRGGQPNNSLRQLLTVEAAPACIQWIREQIAYSASDFRTVHPVADRPAVGSEHPWAVARADMETHPEARWSVINDDRPHRFRNGRREYLHSGRWEAGVADYLGAIDCMWTRLADEPEKSTAAEGDARKFASRGDFLEHKRSQAREDEIANLRAQLAAMTAERDAAKRYWVDVAAQLDKQRVSANERFDELTAECNRMRPVYDAAMQLQAAIGAAKDEA